MRRSGAASECFPAYQFIPTATMGRDAMQGLALVGAYTALTSLALAYQVTRLLARVGKTGRPRRLLRKKYTELGL
jgi:hypothetical protein